MRSSSYPVVQPLSLSGAEIATLSDEIRDLAASRDAVILAHNYQVAEIQDVADFTGDSLALARLASETSASTIVLCGVHFMAETAAILCPDKRVLIPDLEAGCSLADSLTAAELRAWREQHPGATVVMYVNTSAEVKALTDFCCTSSNAVQVVKHIYESRGDDTEILFGPDRFLGEYVQRRTGRQMHIWDGACHVHAAIEAAAIDQRRAQHPDAELLIHPECACAGALLDEGDADGSTGEIHVLSTGGMLKHVAEAKPGTTSIVATETGMLYPLQRAAPETRFVAADPEAVCPFMKMITLPKLRDSLRDGRFEVTVPGAVADRARLAIERMISIS